MREMKLKYKDQYSIRYGDSTVMTMCLCGDVFRAHGAWDEVNRKQKLWQAEHKDCSVKKREGSRTFWMSFCDGDLPKGRQFLGACVIDVTAAEADDAAIDVLLRFPFAQPDAEWLAAATKKAH